MICLEWSYNSGNDRSPCRRHHKGICPGGTVYFIVVGIIGTLLRARYVAPVVLSLDFSNLVHAHSHVAYFGWSSLTLIGVIYKVLPRLTGKPLRGVRIMRWQLWLTHLATVGALVTFAQGGYNPLSIIFSTLNVLLWYVFIWLYRQNVKGVPRPLPVALRYLHGAVALLFVSSLGTWLISAVTALGGDGVLREAGLNIFLTNFTDGWLLLGLLGCAVALLPPPKDKHKREEDEGGARPVAQERWAAGPLPWMVAFTPFTFLAELVPLDVPAWALVIGLIARFALVVPYAWFLWNAVAVCRTSVFSGAPWTPRILVGAAFFFLSSRRRFTVGSGWLPSCRRGNCSSRIYIWTCSVLFLAG